MTMAHGLSLIPVYLVDFGGACLMLGLSCAALVWAKRLKEAEPESILASYLFWLCGSLALLSVSRAGGHLVKIFLYLSGRNDIWRHIAPVTGGINTLSFAAVALLTFYFPNVGRIIQRVKEDAERIKMANLRLKRVQDALRLLNHTLEERVELRTRELRESQSRFRNLFQRTGDMIYFTDAEGRILDINPSGLRLLGLESREEALGRRLREFFPDEEWERYRSAMEREGVVTELETRLVRADGGEVWVMVSANPMKTGGQEEWQGIVKDITQYREMMEKLAYSEKMASVGQMAAGVAHEINNPLAVILGYIDLMMDEVKEEKLAEDLEVVKRQALICRRIVSDLLQFARQDAAHTKAPFDLNLLVQETVAMVAHPLEMHNISFETDLCEGDLVITGDRGRIGQVLVNLIYNARDAMQQGGTIHCATTLLEDGWVELVVADTGSGIEPEIQDRVFDPFFTTKPVGKGTGLGLAVSYGIVKEHGGTISLESPPNDQDLRERGFKTLFRLRFPGRGGGV